ncbi:ferritin-like domain-containing protein [Ramlibacter sp. H39-3-26]|uniref:ferritin-like domain-containing protein n=1 Tax=Curvibacter soli TaxID=3031331 RepID=UPI0023D99AAC|nr:ferritin-like domain-containing protein [Ramlibacter sp. H39-3-26]MDF1485940.1 ferritin-like domain-containing protein [Ramlibacter sp. H39-3-26]
MSSDGAVRWKVEDLDFSRIALSEVRADENLFYLASCASFVESGSDLYTRNLVNYFQGDEEVSAWLSGHWEPEELQHGRALRAYVAHVWPEFDWESAYRSFLAEYATYCRVDLLAPTRALEMAARCVVETGTATYYGALARSTAEPVMRDLARRIAADEANHYRHFYGFFQRYRTQERPGRARVLATLGRRTLELKSEDADCAVRHVVRARCPERAADRDYVRRLRERMNSTIRRNLRPDATLRMLMRPLELPPRVQAVIQYPVEQFMQRMFLR